MRSSSSAKTLTVCVAVAAACCWLGDWVHAQSGGEALFLVSGGRGTSDPDTFPQRAALYRLVEGDGDRPLQSVRELVPASLGVNAVQVSYGHRVLTLAAPALQPDRLEVVWMDQPLQRDSASVSHLGDYISLDVALLDIPGRGLVHVFDTGRFPNRLLLGVEVDRKADERRQTELSKDLWRFTRTAGAPGGAVGGVGGLYLYARPDGSLYYTTPAPVLLGYSLPPEAVALGAKAWGMMIHTDDLLAVRPWFKGREHPRDFPNTLLYVLDKRAGQWRAVRLPGGQSWVRAFGPWLAATVVVQAPGRESPGKAQRRTPKGPREATFDVRLQSRFKGAAASGTLLLLHIPSGRELAWQTQQGDSEVLLVVDETVWYRVNRSLYRARIDGDHLGPPELLAEDDALADVHWAFLGPR